MSKIAGPKMFENRSSKVRNLEAGTQVVWEVNPIMQFCFTMEIQASALASSSLFIIKFNGENRPARGPRSGPYGL